jgi:NMD protein affecting ribosome stability and mRNA decay
MRKRIAPTLIVSSQQIRNGEVTGLLDKAIYVEYANHNCPRCARDADATSAWNSPLQFAQ